MFCVYFLAFAHVLRIFFASSFDLQSRASFLLFLTLPPSSLSFPPQVFRRDCLICSSSFFSSASLMLSFLALALSDCLVE